MIFSLNHSRSSIFCRIISTVLIFIFSFGVIIPPHVAQAQVIPLLPIPGTMVTQTPGYIPVLIKGVTVHPENPLAFDFIIDTGDSDIDINSQEFNNESMRLIKQFLASLTVPANEMWVNLSPYEEERIIPDAFAKTQMGMDLLAQDYLLKQLTSSLVYPEDELGKEFWNRVYERAQKEFGTRDVKMDNFHKVWIVPNDAFVYEKDNTAFVVSSHLKVMMEEDYLAMQNNQSQVTSDKSQEKGQMSALQTEMMREIILPEIEKEVNEGENFAPLRQVYRGMILATWFKQNLKESLLGQVYVDQKKLKGVDIDGTQTKEDIYQQYVKAFEKGVYNYIKEDYDPQAQDYIPRQYFSGGAHHDESAVRTVKHENATPEERRAGEAAAAEEIGDTAKLETNLAESEDEAVRIQEKTAGKNEAPVFAERMALLEALANGSYGDRIEQKTQRVNKLKMYSTWSNQAKDWTLRTMWPSRRWGVPQGSVAMDVRFAVTGQPVLIRRVVIEQEKMADLAAVATAMKEAVESADQAMLAEVVNLAMIEAAGNSGLVIGVATIVARALIIGGGGIYLMNQAANKVARDRIREKILAVISSLDMKIMKETSAELTAALKLDQKNGLAAIDQLLAERGALTENQDYLLTRLREKLLIQLEGESLLKRFSKTTSIQKQKDLINKIADLDRAQDEFNQDVTKVFLDVARTGKIRDVSTLASLGEILKQRNVDEVEFYRIVFINRALAPMAEEHILRDQRLDREREVFQQLDRDFPLEKELQDLDRKQEIYRAFPKAYQMARDNGGFRVKFLPKAREKRVFEVIGSSFRTDMIDGKEKVTHVAYQLNNNGFPGSTVFPIEQDPQLKKGELFATEEYRIVPEEVVILPPHVDLSIDEFQREFLNEVRADRSGVALLKPDALKSGFADRIVHSLRQQGLKVEVGPQIRLNSEQIDMVYGNNHGQQAYYPLLKEHMASGPVVPLFIMAKDKGMVERMKLLARLIREKYDVERPKDLIQTPDTIPSAVEQAQRFLQWSQEGGFDGVGDEAMLAEGEMPKLSELMDESYLSGLSDKRKKELRESFENILQEKSQLIADGLMIYLLEHPQNVDTDVRVLFDRYITNMMKWDPKEILQLSSEQKKDIFQRKYTGLFQRKDEISRSVEDQDLPIFDIFIPENLTEAAAVMITEQINAALKVLGSDKIFLLHPRAEGTSFLNSYLIFGKGVIEHRDGVDIYTFEDEDVINPMMYLAAQVINHNRIIIIRRAELRRLFLEQISFSSVMYPVHAALFNFALTKTGFHKDALPQTTDDLKNSTWEQVEIEMTKVHELAHLQVDQYLEENAGINDMDALVRHLVDYFPLGNAIYEVMVDVAEAGLLKNLYDLSREDVEKATTAFYVALNRIEGMRFDQGNQTNIIQSLLEAPIMVEAIMETGDVDFDLLEEKRQQMRKFIFNYFSDVIITIGQDSQREEFINNTIFKTYSIDILGLEEAIEFGGISDRLDQQIMALTDQAMLADYSVLEREDAEILQAAEQRIADILKAGFDNGDFTKEIYESSLKNTYQNLALWTTDKDIYRLSPGIRDANLKAIRSGRWEDVIEAYRGEVPFGTAGIRGFATLTQDELRDLEQYGPGAAILKGPNTINDITLLKKTQAVINMMKEQGQTTVQIGYDSRVAGRQFAEMLARQFIAASTPDHMFKIYLFDEASPFPELSFGVTTEAAKSDWGIFISASHNPRRYNGYKITRGNGAQLNQAAKELVLAADSKVQLSEIKVAKALVDAKEGQLVWLSGSAKLENRDYYGFPSIDMHSQHIARVKKFLLDHELIKDYGKEVKIGFAAYNGAGYKAVPRLLTEAGFTNFKVVEELQEMDGMFPAFNPEEQPDPGDPNAGDVAVKKFIDEYGQETFDQLDALIGTDPDADRMGLTLKIPEDQQKYLGKYRLFSANDAWTLLIWYRLMKKQKMGLLDPANSRIVFSHVTTDALEAVAGLFGVKAVGDMMDRTGKEDRGGYLSGRRTWVGFTYIGDWFERLASQGLYAEAGAEESNEFSIGGHVLDKDGTFAAILMAEVLAYAKKHNTTAVDLLDNIYRQIGFYATANKPLPRVGSFKGAAGISEKIKMVQKAEEWMEEANERAGTNNPLMIAGREVIGAVSFGSNRVDHLHYENIPDEGIRFFFKDEINVSAGTDFTNSRNYVTLRISGTSQTIRVYTQLWDPFYAQGAGIAKLKAQMYAEAEAVSLITQAQLIKAVDLQKYLHLVSQQLDALNVSMKKVGLDTSMVSLSKAGEVELIGGTFEKLKFKEKTALLQAADLLQRLADGEHQGVIESRPNQSNRLSYSRWHKEGQWNIETQPSIARLPIEEGKGFLAMHVRVIIGRNKPVFREIIVKREEMNDLKVVALAAKEMFSSSDSEFLSEEQIADWAQKRNVQSPGMQDNAMISAADIAKLLADESLIISGRFDHKTGLDHFDIKVQNAEQAFDVWKMDVREIQEGKVVIRLVGPDYQIVTKTLTLHSKAEILNGIALLRALEKSIELGDLSGDQAMLGHEEFQEFMKEAFRLDSPYRAVAIALLARYGRAVINEDFIDYDHHKARWTISIDNGQGGEQQWRLDLKPAPVAHFFDIVLTASDGTSESQRYFVPYQSSFDAHLTLDKFLALKISNDIMHGKLKPSAIKSKRLDTGMLWEFYFPLSSNSWQVIYANLGARGYNIQIFFNNGIIDQGEIDDHEFNSDPNIGLQEAAFLFWESLALGSAQVSLDHAMLSQEQVEKFKALKTIRSAENLDEIRPYLNRQDFIGQVARQRREQLETKKGGIDLDPNFLDLKIRRNGDGIPLPLPQQSIEEMRQIEGFLPVIINVTPITNLPMMLGMEGDSDEDDNRLSELDAFDKVAKLD